MRILALLRAVPAAVIAGALLAGPAAPRAHAQIGLYGEFTAEDFNLPNTDWQYGTTFGLFYDRWHIPFFALGLDGRGSVVGSGSTTIASGLGGPRVSLHPHVLPVMPYAEALVGGAHIDYGQGVAQTSATELEYQFLAGADLTIFPHVDWRVAEFSYGGFSGGLGLNPRSIGTGIVVRLP